MNKYKSGTEKQIIKLALLYAMKEQALTIELLKSSSNEQDKEVIEYLKDLIKDFETIYKKYA